MKKEIKFSINESLHSELQAIVENKKTDENQLIEGIISDFITKQNVKNGNDSVKSISWSDNYTRIFACCSWIKESMKDELISNDLFFIQIAYQRIIRNMSSIKPDSEIYTPPTLIQVNQLFEKSNYKKFSNHLATIFYDTKLEFEINEFNSMIGLLSNTKKIKKMSNIEKWKLAIKDSYKKFELINPARAKTELGFANQLFQSNPMLQKCTTESIVNAVVNVARTSITLNPVMRLAYLVPRGDKCVLDFSYMGMVAMLKDNNCIRTIDAKIVYEDEEFDFDMSSNIIYHKPKYSKTEIEHNERIILGCYSRAVLPTNDIVYEFMPIWEIDKIKQSSTNSNSKYSAWTTWRDEMIKKSVIKRHFKMLISLGNINNDKISTFLQIENENNPLKNNFNNQLKPTIKNSFIEQTEIFEESFDFTSEHSDNKDEISEDDEREMFNDLFNES